VCPHAQIQRELVSPDKKIRCVLVHDHVLLRQGLRRLLEDEPDLEVVCEASDAAEALQRVFEYRPEVVIADVQTFGMPFDDAEDLILRESPHTRIVFLSMHEGGVSAAPDNQAGGRQCTVRYSSAEELTDMVRGVGRGNSLRICESSRERRSWRSADSMLPRRRVLTEREREVLKLLAEGRTVRSAASILGLSSKTVDAHKFNLMRKLGLHNKAELVMWAVQQRVVKVPAVL